MVKVIRHGDLLLVPDGEIPDGNLKNKKDNCVLDWEVTGHHHRVGAGATVQLLDGEQTEENNYFRGVVTVKKWKPVKITHEEHNEIELTTGKYTAYVQREYDLLENRRVVD